MSAVLKVPDPNATYLVPVEPPLVRGFELLVLAPGGVARLRELIIEFAIRGRLTTQNLVDEPAIRLVAKAQAQRGALATRQKLPAAQREKFASFALPGGWCWSCLSEIGLISPRNEASDETPASFVQMSSIPTAMTESHTTETRQWRDIKSGFTHFAEGDIGVAKITPCFENGKSAVFRGLTNGIGAGTTELHIVRPLGGVLPEYILAFLKSPGFLRNGEAVMTGSAGQRRMPRAYFEGTPFPLPPLAEQYRIVARVEELLRLCDALEQSGRLADEQHARLSSTLFDDLAASESAHTLAENWQRIAEHFDLLLDRPEAVDGLEQTILQLAVRGLLVPQNSADEPASVLLQKIRIEKDRLVAEGKIKRDKPLPEIGDEAPFTLPQLWKWVTLESLASQITDGAHHTPTYVSEGVPFLSVKNLSSGVMDFSDTRFISVAAHEELAKRCNPEFGDLLLTKIGTTGIAVVVNTTQPFSLFVSVALLKLPRGSVDKNFLSLVINSPFVRKQSADGTEGVGNKNLVLRKIKAFQIPLPPLAEQSRIVARVESLRHLCAGLRQCLSTAQDTQRHLAEVLVEQAL